MISFNTLGFESMTGEPNTWNPRVSLEQPLTRRDTLKDLPSRGLDAAFALIDHAREQEDLKFDAMIRERLEQDAVDNRVSMEHVMHPDTKPPENWHEQEKARHAQRREMKLQYKNRDTDL